MNLAGRFQFPTLMIAAAALPGSTGEIRRAWRPIGNGVANWPMSAFGVLVVFAFASHNGFKRQFDGVSPPRPL